MIPLILVLNCGSSSIKFALFDMSTPTIARQPSWHGKVDGIGSPQASYGDSQQAQEAVPLDSARPYHSALSVIRARVRAYLSDTQRIACVAHRVVHGGSKYFAPVRMDAQVLADLKSYIPLAPLHQPFALEAIEELFATEPDLPQIACFDTAFHRTQAPIEQMLALPWSVWERGVRRYGFHGLSYEYMSHALPERHGELANGRVIVAHLGNGASLCALQSLQSVATTMGFSALDGLMMGSRCGSIDPGAVIYLMQIEKLSLEAVAHMLYHDSGLRGVSGISGDPRDLLPIEGHNPRASAALALYVRRIVREIGALTAVLGGLDLLVFTAGIGEHSNVLRARICQDLSWLGLHLDAEANARHAAVISTPDSPVTVGVEKTNEEWIAAWHSARLLATAA
ncbi:acetate/propionate family kinase [Castellaniella sp.]|uniref:acetate/propionate family kinase n=1 Tax=Castellaniella sp. TaxID=1955812 RepID=UPI0035613C31